MGNHHGHHRARVVGLPRPTERPKSEEYFQRYFNDLPASGEITNIDRKGYNRVDERVMAQYSPGMNPDDQARRLKGRV